MPRARLLAGAAGLSALFLLDDTFQLHKPVVPDWTGLPSSAVLASYACLFIVWAWVCRHEIARTEVTILVVTLAFFALWYGCKVASPFAARTSIEISAKLCGVAGWALYVCARDDASLTVSRGTRLTAVRSWRATCSLRSLVAAAVAHSDRRMRAGRTRRAARAGDRGGEDPDDECQGTDHEQQR